MFDYAVTNMRRDQWFSILIGFKRTEPGKVEDYDEAGSDFEWVKEDSRRGRLQPAEERLVVLDLRPLRVKKHALPKITGDRIARVTHRNGV